MEGHYGWDMECPGACCVSNPNKGSENHQATLGKGQSILRAYSETANSWELFRSEDRHLV